MLHAPALRLKAGKNAQVLGLKRYAFSVKRSAFEEGN